MTGKGWAPKTYLLLPLDSFITLKSFICGLLMKINNKRHHTRVIHPCLTTHIQSIMPTLALLSLHGQFPLSIEHSSLSFLASPSYLSDPSLWSSLTAQSKVYTPPVFYHIA